jgi:hypothetical protein
MTRLRFWITETSNVEGHLDQSLALCEGLDRSLAFGYQDSVVAAKASTAAASPSRSTRVWSCRPNA